MPDLSEQFATYDALLKDGLGILGVYREIGEIKLPKVILDYSETPNDELIDNADLLIEQLKVLSGKFHNFIIQSFANPANTNIFFKNIFLIFLILVCQFLILYFNPYFK